MLANRRGGFMRSAGRFAASFAHSLVSQLAVSVAAALILKCVGQAWLLPAHEPQQAAAPAPVQTSLAARAGSAAADVVALAAYPLGTQDQLAPAAKPRRSVAEQPDPQKAAPPRLRKKKEEPDCSPCVVPAPEAGLKDGLAAAVAATPAPAAIGSAAPAAPATVAAAPAPAIASRQVSDQEASPPAGLVASALAVPSSAIAQVGSGVAAGLQTARTLVAGTAGWVTAPVRQILAP